LIPVQDWSKEIVRVLDDDNLGILNATVCLLTAVVQTYPDLFSGCVAKVIMRLNAVGFFLFTIYKDCCSRKF
jgi:hypothetical protein